MNAHPCSPSARHPSSHVIFRRALGTLAFSASSLLFAAAGGPPPVTVNQPVTIKGAVEVLNDLTRTPFAQTGSSGVAPVDQPTVTFDIPENKRLIIETIAFQASQATNDTNRLFLQPLVNPTTRLLVPLPVQTLSVEGVSTYSIGMHAITLRLDSQPGSTSELQVRRGSGTPGTLSVAVFGYLVDKPQG